MQTFLPYPDFAQSAACLDDRRLGKQRFHVIEFVEWTNDRRRVLHTVYVRETPIDIIVWTADFLATGKVPQAALAWHTPGVGR